MSKYPDVTSYLERLEGKSPAPPTELIVPILLRRDYGYPFHGDLARVIVYVPLGIALKPSAARPEREYLLDDYHTAGYALPSVPRRLATAAALELGPVMQMFFADIDGPAHKWTPEWWAEMRPKLERLLARHHGLYCYTTRGGCRIVGRLAQPFTLRERRDAARWKASYLSWLDYLVGDFEIVADRACAPWNWIFRLPRVTRDGVQTVLRDELGDPLRVGVWDRPYVEPTDATDTGEHDPLPILDSAPDAELKRKIAEALQPTWPPSGQRHPARLATANILARCGWQQRDIAEVLHGIAAAENNDDVAACAIRDLGATAKGWPTLRSLVGDTAADTFGELLRPPPGPGDDLLAIIAATRASAAQPPTAATSSQRELPPARPLSFSIADAIGDIRRMANMPTIQTPWPAFNERTGGLELGTVAVGVGYQGSGKSSWAAQLGAHYAETGWTIYYLGEMTLRMLAARIVGQRRKLSWQRVLRGELSDSDMHAVLDPLHLRVVPRATNPISAIRQALAEVREQSAAPVLLIVDYVQLLAPATKDIRTSTMQIVRDLQELIESESLAGFVLSQTSRANSKRAREGAEDSIDLADVGAETAEIERSAALQFVLSYQQKDDTRIHEVTMAISKRRFGGPTQLYYDYDGETGLWLERSTSVKRTSEQQREDAILDELRTHAAGTCMGAEHTRCMAVMSGNTLSEGFRGVGGNRHHKVVGNKTAMLKTLARLVKERKLVKVGTEYQLPKISPDLSAYEPRK